MAQTYGFAVIPWSPIGGGLMTGKYRGGKMPEIGRYTNVSELAPTIARHFTPKVFRVLEKLDPIAAEKRCTLAQLALSWVLGRPGVTSPIIGPRTMEQFEDNLGALEADFGPHLHRCP